MSDSKTIIVVFVILALAAMWYCRRKSEGMMSTSMATSMPTSMPNMDAVSGTDPTASGQLMPADSDTVDYSPYSGSVAPCTSMSPYA